MNIILMICGFHSLFFAVFHCMFWKKLHWKTQLPKLNDVNNAVMQILNLRIIYLCLFFAFVCFFFTDEVLHTPLGTVFLYGLSLFWIGRTVEQFIYRKLLPFNNPLSIFITFLFFLGSILYLIPIIYE